MGMYAMRSLTSLLVLNVMPYQGVPINVVSMVPPIVQQWTTEIFLVTPTETEKAVQMYTQE